MQGIGLQDNVLRCHIRVKVGEEVFWDFYDAILRPSAVELVLVWKWDPERPQRGRTPHAVVRIPNDDFLMVSDPLSDHEIESAVIIDLDGATFRHIESGEGGWYCVRAV